MARPVADLDQRDYDTRIRIRGELREARELEGITQRTLGQRLGIDGANVRRLERQGVAQSYTATVLRWARALDRRLVLEPVGFPPPAPLTEAVNVNDIMALLMAEKAGRHLPVVDDGWLVSRTVAELAGIRVACRVTHVQLAARFRVTPTAVGLIEASGAASALVVLQRHARGIGLCSRRREAYLDVRLEMAPNVEHHV